MPPKAASKEPSGVNTPGFIDKQDNAMMAMCLQKLDPLTRKIDAVAVAEALGYANPNSIGNRWSAVKKYNLKFEMAYPPRSSGPTSPQDTANPKVSHDKVQKKRGGRKPAAKAPEPKTDDEDSKVEDAKVNENEA